jgi:SAM-dependent methyltransferase
MSLPSPVNPFYARRLQRNVTRTDERPLPRYARLPLAPKNGSPVPHLTSLYHFHRAGEYGSRAWPGNCGGNLIRDVLMYFRPEFVMDPMAGSGTCGDVCKELNIPCMAFDIHQGFDACDPKEFTMEAMFDFIWAHPAYWRMKLYADTPKDLSRSPTLEHFLTRYGQFIQNAARALKPGGKLAILMGDYSDKDEGFVPLTYHTKRLAFAAGLKQHCTDIIRFSHGASSSHKVYRSAFIPGLHDTLCIFEKSDSPQSRQ